MRPPVRGISMASMGSPATAARRRDWGSGTAAADPASHTAARRTASRTKVGGAALSQCLRSHAACVQIPSAIRVSPLPWLTLHLMDRKRAMLLLQPLSSRGAAAHMLPAPAMGHLPRPGSLW